MPTTLDGYTPKVGDHVWQQMYSPQQPHWSSTIEERVAGGITYGPRRRMVVEDVSTDTDGTQRWVLTYVDKSEQHGYPYSSVNSDWCVLELDGEAEWQEALL